MSEVLIFDHGGTNGQRVPVTGVQCSWEISQAGSFSAFARLEDLRAAGLGYDLSGKWLTYGHPSAGEWGGVISGRPVQNEVVEIAADGWAALLQGRVLDEWETPPSGQVGGLARRAIVASDSGGGMLTLGTVDEGGEPVAVLVGGQDALDDFLPLLVDAAGLEWMIDSDRRLHLSRRLGIDRSATVRLIEGTEIVEARIADDAWTRAAAERLGIESNRERVDAGAGGGPRRRKSRRRIRRRGGNRDRWRPGRRRTRFVMDPAQTDPGPSGDALVQWDVPPLGVSVRSLAVPPQPSNPLETSPAELVLADINNAWQYTQLGDVVGILYGSAGLSGWFRVVARGFDEASGELTVAGECLPDRWSVAA